MSEHTPLTEDEIRALEEAAWRGGASGWRAEIGRIIAARLADAEARAEAAEAKVARVDLLRAKYAGRSKWVGYEKPRREAWEEIERDLREALRGDQ